MKILFHLKLLKLGLVRLIIGQSYKSCSIKESFGHFKKIMSPYFNLYAYYTISKKITFHMQI